MSASMWWRRAVARLRRSRLDDELRAEIQDHLERRREQLVSEGMSPAEAEAAARRAFGNVVNVREQMHKLMGIVDAALEANALKTALDGQKFIMNRPWNCEIRGSKTSLRSDRKRARVPSSSTLLSRP